MAGPPYDEGVKNFHGLSCFDSASWQPGTVAKAARVNRFLARLQRLLPTTSQFIFFSPTLPAFCLRLRFPLFFVWHGCLLLGPITLQLSARSSRVSSDTRAWKAKPGPWQIPVPVNLRCSQTVQGNEIRKRQRLHWKLRGQFVRRQAFCQERKPEDPEEHTVSGTAPFLVEAQQRGGLGEDTGRRKSQVKRK